MRLRQTIIITGAALVAGVGHAHAETAAPAADISEIVVTAEKRAQPLLEVPIAASVFSGARRDELGLRTVQDLANFTPGLQYSSQLDRLSLRGVGRTTNVRAADPSVAVYSDGIYVPATIEANKSDLFLDLTEVLRGPQATLYGRNAIAGAINLVSRRPTEDMYGEVRATYANYNHSTLEGAVSGPTSIPGVQFRLGASWEKQTKGWYDNIVPGQPDEGNVIDERYVEGQLKLKFNDRLEAWTKLSWMQWLNGAGGPGSRASWTPSPYATFEVNNGGTTLEPGYGCSGRTTGVVNPSPMGCVNPQLTDPRKIASTVPFQVNLNPTWIFASEWLYHFDAADLKYTTGGAHYHLRVTRPPDDSVAPVTQYVLPGGLVVNPQQVYNYAEDESWWSHELTLTSTRTGPVQWLVGLYDWSETFEQPFTSSVPGQFQLAAPSNLSCPITRGCTPNPDLLRAGDLTKFDISSRAAYAQADWTFAPAWKASASIRYSEDRKKGSEEGRVLCFAVFQCTPGLSPEQTGRFTPAVDLTEQLYTPGGALPRGVTSTFTFDPATGRARRTYDGTWSATTGNVTLQWLPDAATDVYVRYSHGYKPGGFRASFDVVLTARPYTNAEHVNDIEVGFKKAFGQRLQTNIAVFNYDYRDAQIPLTTASTGSEVTPPQSTFYNVPKAVSRGFEMETIWRPVDNLQVQVNYAYLDAHITKSDAVVDPADPAALDQNARPVITFAACRATPGLCATDIFTALTGGGFQRGQDVKGQRLPNAPRNQVAVNTAYTWNLDAGDVTGSVSYIWRDVQYGSIFNRTYTRSSSWDQWDARLTFRARNRPYTLILWGQNLLNDVGYAGGASAVRRAGLIGPATAGGGSNQYLPVVQGITTGYPITPPRTYGVTLQYRFM